jgi:ankyrin repeat protein
MPLLQLPDELLLLIAQYLTSEKDISALALTNRFLYNFLNIHLYRFHVLQHGGGPALLWAAEHGQEGATRLLLEAGAGAQAITKFRDSKYRMTPLSWAAYKGHEAIVNLLLSTESVHPTSDDSSRYLVSWAAEGGHVGVVKILLEKGARFGRSDGSYRTPLSIAAEHGHEAVVKLLLEKGASPESATFLLTRTPLAWAAGNGHEEVVKMLLEKGADPGARFTSDTPLAWAVRHGHEAIVKLLLEKSTANGDAIEEVEYSTLSWSAWCGRESVVKFLLEKRAKQAAKPTLGHEPLLLAAENGHEAVVKLLLATEGIDVNHKGSERCEGYGMTALSAAAMNNHVGIVKLLLASENLDVNLKDKLGWTALSWAAQNYNNTLIKLLLDNGADKYPYYDMCMRLKRHATLYPRIACCRRPSLEPGQPPL